MMSKSSGSSRRRPWRMRMIRWTSAIASFCSTPGRARPRSGWESARSRCGGRRPALSRTAADRRSENGMTKSSCPALNPPTDASRTRPRRCIAGRRRESSFPIGSVADSPNRPDTASGRGRRCSCDIDLGAGEEPAEHRDPGSCDREVLGRPEDEHRARAALAVEHALLRGWTKTPAPSCTST